MTSIELKNKLIVASGGDIYKDAFAETRAKAIQVFDTLGFPILKNEEWKYTDISSIINRDYTLGIDGDVCETCANDLSALYPNSNILIFVNGAFSELRSTIISKDIEITSYSGNHALAKEFESEINSDNNALYALNNALFTDGAIIKIGKNKEIAEPIVIANIGRAKEYNKINFTKNFIALATGAKATIIETYLAKGENFAFENVSTEILVGENANLEYYKIQNEKATSIYFGTTHVKQMRDSNFEAFAISLGEGFTRNEIYIELNGVNATNKLNGFYLGLGSAVIDNKTYVDHISPNCSSEEVYKGIAGDSAKCVFNGKILVERDAQKTNAYQSNKNILLSDTATIRTKPQLEIYADDVKCSHGATTGQLDQEALFYMMSRGIDRAEALILLLNAFSQDVVGKIRIDWLKERIENAIHEKLK